MDKKIGLLSRTALASASCLHGYQSTGLTARCNEYGLFMDQTILAGMLAQGIANIVSLRPTLLQTVSTLSQ